MRGTIQVNCHPIETGAREAYADVAAVVGGSAGREILPETAVTIAALWQSSGSVGHVLAGFASGGAVDRDELLDDIYRTRLHHGYYTREMDARDRDALDCLSTFVLNYGSGV